MRLGAASDWLRDNEWNNNTHTVLSERMVKVTLTVRCAASAHAHTHTLAFLLTNG